MSKDKSTGGRGASWDRPKKKKNYRLCCLIANKKLEKALRRLK